MNDALDDVRAAEARRLARDGYEPVLKKTRWCVLKRKANLTPTQRFRLRDLLRYNLKTVRAYLLKEDFQQFWDYDSPTWAAKFLDDWCQQAMRSRIEPMKKVAKTLRGHRELILNYFRAKKQFSSGVVEGLNNKAKLTMRKSYGFRTFRVTEIALYHALGKLPEPETCLTIPNALSLELCEGAQHVEKALSVRRAGVNRAARSPAMQGLI
jgi:transposase